MDLADKKNEEIISNWLIEKADILPSRALHYSQLIVSSGIGSIQRLTKKIKKNNLYLIEIV